MFCEIEDIQVEDRWLDTFAEASGFCAEYFLERYNSVLAQCAERWRDGRPALIETSDSLLLHIPPGNVGSNKNLKVTEISAETAMRFSQIYDDIPPLCQMVVKIVTVATRRGFYKLSFKSLWEAMNDLLAEGVDGHHLNLMVDELVEICVLRVEDNDHRTVGLDLHSSFAASKFGGSSAYLGGNPCVLSIQSPALADTVMDVCTPVQIRSIAKVLIERLQPQLQKNFQVGLVIASLHSLLEEDHEVVARLWESAYKQFLRQSRDYAAHTVKKWKEIIDDEICSVGLHSKQVLGSDFVVGVTPRRRLSPCLSMLKTYVAPVSLGPLGQSFSVICRNTFHEYGLFCKGGAELNAERLNSSTGSASGRYMMEMSVVENYLREWGIGAPQNEIEAEMEMISFMANPAESPDGVETKAVLIVEEVIPRFIEHRLQRLYKLVSKLKECPDPFPDAFQGVNRALCRAYQALQVEPPKTRNDGAQDALMILATTNWKPPSTLEFLPLKHQLTVANIRNATLKRLTDAEFMMRRHQQSIDDLEAFLIVTALIMQARANGLC